MRQAAAFAALGMLLLLPTAAPPRPSLLEPGAERKATVAESVDVANAGFAPAPAPPAPPAPPRDLLAEVRANFTPENRAYAHTRVVLDFVDPGYLVIVCLLVLFSGLSSRLRNIAAGFGHRRYVQVLVYLLLFGGLMFVATLPLAWYRGFALEHQYGLSNQTLGAWLVDEVKGTALTLAFLGVVPLVWLAYRAIRRSPKRWWLWLGFGSIPVVVLAVLLQPLVFEPAFNKFEPLRDPVLRREILDLAARAGIPSRNVLQANKSLQTKKFNAYVSGFGASQRIVLWDTILDGMERDEILFVMGHEMGHYKLGHIWKIIAFLSAMGFVLFFLAGVLTRFGLARFGEQWGVRELHDIASLPLLLAVLVILTTAAQPAMAGYSRLVEHESDVFGLEITRDNAAAARAFLKLGSQNRSDPEPSPLVRAMLYDHPPLAERIGFALEYRPWEKGEPNRLFHGRP